MKYFCSLFFLLPFAFVQMDASPVSITGQPVRIEVRSAGDASIRVTIMPASYKEGLPQTPAIAKKDFSEPVLIFSGTDKPTRKIIGNLLVEINQDPLSIRVSTRDGREVQKIILHNNGDLLFKLYGEPVLGLGEGGSLPARGADWRNLPVEYDRRGLYHKMQPRWQSDAYGSRNPVAMLTEPGSWAIFVSSPWVEVDLRDKDNGIFIPWKPVGNEVIQQSAKTQQLNITKGIPPISGYVPGLFDFFVFDASDPLALMKDFSGITGPSAMPPKWTMGYMQSHRTLEDENQLHAIVDSFRAKRIPIDAVIYLGTGFTPRGWNKPQPSFEFNPEVFKSTPEEFISKMHDRNVKVILHMVPWDRDRLPSLQGNIPPAAGEQPDASHILNYWNEHIPLVNAGVDAFWPDEGDWFNLFERIKRYQMYYQGYLQAKSGIRPWSLQRNGYPGIARWGGWVWSGDTQSAWKTLEAQIAVGLNYSISIGPYWGSDIGGFYPTRELTGELYARWIQFGTFCASFRSHGRTWWTRLPWGWGLNDMGPAEGNITPLQSEMNNKLIEPVVKKYIELRYQLLQYNYSLTWDARKTGLPMMRAMWLHYPEDELCRKTGDQYLWGKDMLVAPVYQKEARSRSVYLPEGKWYDWWTDDAETGGRLTSRDVDLSTIPIYVRAGAIIPVDSVRQFTSQLISSPTLLKVYTGSNGEQVLYEDDGFSQKYLTEEPVMTIISWDDKRRTLSLKSNFPDRYMSETGTRIFRVQLIPGKESVIVKFTGKPLKVRL